MHVMRWSYPDLMALPASYRGVLREFVEGLLKARKREK